MIVFLLGDLVKHKPLEKVLFELVFIDVPLLAAALTLAFLNFV